MMRVLRAVGGVDAAVQATYASAARLDTLEDVLRWGGDVRAVIVQDEYTHDVVVAVAGGYLVFDTT